MCHWDMSGTVSIIDITSDMTIAGACGFDISLIGFILKWCS